MILVINTVIIYVALFIKEDFLSFNFIKKKVFNTHKLTGFTLAEVLITLGIVGVVAALTIPMLMTKFEQEKTVNALKKSYATLGHLVKRIEYEYGSVEGMNGTSETWWQRDKQKIVKGSIAPLLPGGQVIDSPNGSSTMCFIEGSTRLHTSHDNKEVQYIRPNGGTWTLNGNDRMMAVLLQDGSCIGFDVTTRFSDVISMSVYVDINGPAQPNVVGRDFFEFIVTRNGDVYPLGYNETRETVNRGCHNAASTTGSGSFCASKIMRDGWKIQKDYPWKLNLRNGKL